VTGSRPDPTAGRRGLAGIELVVFDKDGTLIDFDRMWSGWSADLVRKLVSVAGDEVRSPLVEALGLDPGGERVIPGSPLAAWPMARLRELTVATLVDAGLALAEAEAAVARSWHPPDPVALAHPLTDLGALFGALRGRGIRVAVATSDDRGPTEATLAGLGIAGLVDALVCADDGLPVKPEPDALLHLCDLLGVDASRAAMVGDSAADVAMGRAAGAGLVVGVLSGVGSRAELEPFSDTILGSVGDLLPN
jgi:phosphoglycolate phosphatase-like HAD superfamily hydrolase